MSLIEVKLRPTGPWRVGHRAGDRERVDVIYHSDALYSAVTHAMRALGWLTEWLEATAAATGDPAVRFSSLFPFMGKTRLVTPPKSAWPPALPGRLYLQGAKLIPLEIVKSGLVDESRWTVDGESQCLVPLGGSAPFRISMRSAAAVDRLTGVAEPFQTACLEFAPNAGLWGVFSVSDPVWESRVKTALRLLADSGFGGERSRGWGRASEPHFAEASHLFAATGVEKCWWLLSLFSPHEQDVVDWSRGEFTATVRGGWTDSPAGAGAKKQVRMMEEGSVLAADSLRGRAVDVAPDGFPHPVYRAGFALAMPAPAEILLRPPTVSRQPVAPAAEPIVVARPEVTPVEPETPVVEHPATEPEPLPEIPATVPEPAAPVDVPAAEPETTPDETPAADPQPEPAAPGNVPAEPETSVEPAPPEPELPSAEPEPAVPADEPAEPVAPAEPDAPAEPASPGAAEHHETTAPHNPGEVPE